MFWVWFVLQVSLKQSRTLNSVKISTVLSLSCSRKDGSQWRKLHLLCVLGIYSLCSKQCCAWSARPLEHHTYGYFMCNVAQHSRADFTGHVSHLGARGYHSFRRKETNYTEVLPTSLGNKQSQCLKLHLAHSSSINICWIFKIWYNPICV